MIRGSIVAHSHHRIHTLMGEHLHYPLHYAVRTLIHKIWLRLFQRISIDFLWKFRVPPFSAHDGTLTACSMEIKPLESGPGLRSNRAGGRLDLFHHAQSKARCSLVRVPALLRGRWELLPVRGADSTVILAPIPGTWSPGVRCPDFSVIQSNEKSYCTSSPPCSLIFAGAKVLDKVLIIRSL